MNVLLVLMFLTVGAGNVEIGYTEKIEMTTMRDCNIAADRFSDSYYQDTVDYTGEHDIFSSFSAVCIRIR